jgi:hypothetical protein
MDAYDRYTNLGKKKSCRQCCNLWSRQRTFQTTLVSSRADGLAKSSDFQRKDALDMTNLVGSQLTALHMLTSQHTVIHIAVTFKCNYPNWCEIG